MATAFTTEEKEAIRKKLQLKAKGNVCKDGVKKPQLQSNIKHGRYFSAVL